MKVSQTLKRICNTQNSRFVKTPSYDLHPNWETITRETTGNRCGGMTSRIEEPGVAKQQRTYQLALSVYCRVLLAERCCGNRRHRSDKHVAILQRAVNFCTHQSPYPLTIRVISSREKCTNGETFADHLTVIIP